MKKLVIFDLDGTLLDTLKSIQYCANVTIGEFGYEPLPLEPFRYFVGDGANELIKRVLKASGNEELIGYEKVIKRYRQVFLENCMYQVKPYEGILELLSALKEKGILLAVNTNKPQESAVKVIETVFGKECFHMVIGQSNDRERKPSPEGVLYIGETLGVEKEGIIYLGDTSTDMKTGKSAGVFTVGALWGFRDRAELEEYQADAIIKKPMELLTYIG